MLISQWVKKNFGAAMVVVAVVLLYVFVVYTGLRKHLSFYDYLYMSLWRL